LPKFPTATTHSSAAERRLMPAGLKSKCRALLSGRTWAHAWVKTRVWEGRNRTCREGLHVCAPS
jgi:hypothetical protein